jgi:hypothetical protein
VVSFTTHVTLLLEKEAPQYPPERRLGETQSLSGHCSLRESNLNHPAPVAVVRMRGGGITQRYYEVLHGNNYSLLGSLTSPTGCGRSVGIVRLRTKTTEFSCFFLGFFWLYDYDPCLLKTTNILLSIIRLFPSLLLSQLS